MSLAYNTGEIFAQKNIDFNLITIFHGVLISHFVLNFPMNLFDERLYS